MSADAQSLTNKHKSLEENNVIKFDIREYLESQPRSIFEELYTEPATCLGVVRLLPALARHAVFRFLPLTEPIPRSGLALWVQPDAASILGNELKRLLRLHILIIPEIEDEIPLEVRERSKISFSKFLYMNKTFRKGLFAALSGSSLGHSFGRLADESVPEKTSTVEVATTPVQQGQPSESNGVSDKGTGAPTIRKIKLKAKREIIDDIDGNDDNRGQDGENRIPVKRYSNGDVKDEDDFIVDDEADNKMRDDDEFDPDQVNNENNDMDDFMNDIESEADKKRKMRNEVNVSFLDKYASAAWEAVLHYLVGTPTLKRHTSAVRHLLTVSGLQERNPNYDAYSENPAENQKYRITSKGFQFLLQGVNVQLWALMLQYVEQADIQLNLKVTDILNFFFQSGCLEVGKSYSIDPLTETQRRVLEDLQYFGLFYKPTPDSNRYYPTRIATTLMSDAISSQRVDTSANGFIIVETNYKVYAYTSSPLQIAILSLFLDLQTRFQNMVVASLSRDSVKRALAKGITAEQIISYLTVHAHPEMKKKPQKPGEVLLRPKKRSRKSRKSEMAKVAADAASNSSPVPPTIIDQIKLWEMERNRLKSHPGYIYSNFTSQRSFEEIVLFAQNNDYLLWKSSGRRMLIVTETGHPAIKAYRKQKNELKQQQMAEESTLTGGSIVQEDVNNEPEIDVEGNNGEEAEEVPLQVMV